MGAMLFQHSASKKPGLATYTVEPQWLEYLWNHESMLETGVVRVNER